MSGAADWGRRRLHFVGIGGTGMSGLARICSYLGATVTGSDLLDGRSVQQLRALGVTVAIGHSPANVPDDAELVYSSAVRAENVERVRGRELGLREIRRGHLLAELSRLRRCIAVAGTHGKTTTAAMTVHALRAAGVDAGYVIGAELRDGSPSAHWTDGEWLVVETDESDRTFLALQPEIAVVTNIALEHINEYESLAELRDAFATFLGQSNRAVIADDPELLRLCNGRACTTFATGRISLDREGSRFEWRERTIRLSVPGAHNAANAAAALETSRLVAPAGTDAAAAAIAGFPGAHRRIEQIGSTSTGTVVYEDYAIHANEIRATLAALRTVHPGRIVAVFEPLLFSRTRVMASALAEALAAADAVVVLDVYPGSEAGQQHDGVSGRLVADAVAVDGTPVAYAPARSEAAERLPTGLASEDAIVVMGVSGALQRFARGLLRV